MHIILSAIFGTTVFHKDQQCGFIYLPMVEDPASHISTTLIQMDRQRRQFRQKTNSLHLTHVSSTELLGYINASADDAKTFSFC